MGLEHLLMKLRNGSTRDTIQVEYLESKERTEKIMKYLKSLGLPLDPSCVRDPIVRDLVDNGLQLSGIYEIDNKLHRMLNSENYSESDIKELIESINNHRYLSVIITPDKEIYELKYNYVVIQEGNNGLPLHFNFGMRSAVQFYADPCYDYCGYVSRGTHSLKNARKLVKQIKKLSGKNAMVALELQDDFSLFLLKNHVLERAFKTYFSLYQLGPAHFTNSKERYGELLRGERDPEEPIRNIEKFPILTDEKRKSLKVLSFIPYLKELGKKGSIRLAKSLLSLVSDKKVNLGFALAPIASGTSSLCVGSLGDIIFKISKDESIISKESLVMKRLSEDDFFDGRITSLYNVCKLVKQEKSFKDFELSKNSRYLSGKGLNLLLTCANFNSDYNSKSFLKNKYLGRFFQLLSSEIGVEIEDIAFNPFIHRLYTLSYIHGHALSLFSEDEISKINEDNSYHDYSLKQVKKITNDLLSDKVLDQYEESSERQKRLYNLRGNDKFHPLVFTHGDSKWDNWINGVLLADFGSTKIQTEYKDIAKSLLDCIYIHSPKIIDGYIEIYEKLRKIFSRPMRESLDSFKRNVYDAILTESVRTIYYKHQIPGKEYLVKQLVKIAETYADKIIEMEKEDTLFNDITRKFSDLGKRLEGIKNEHKRRS